MKDNFYTEKINEIKKLIENGELTKAQQELTEELNMPYIPEIYEVEFSKLYQEILHALMSDQPDNKVKALDTIMEMLFGDESAQSIALELISSHNLRPVKTQIKNRIESWTSKDAIKRSFLFEILCEQEINLDILIDGVNVNPIKDQVVDNKTLLEALKIIEELSLKNPQLKDIAFNEVRRFILINFPKRDFEIKSLTNSIYKITASMFNENISLDKKDMEIREILNG